MSKTQNGSAPELRRACLPRHRQGFTVLFMGLSGAGKSTLAAALAAMLRESGERRVTMLDGDAVRRLLSSKLGLPSLPANYRASRTVGRRAVLRNARRFVAPTTAGQGSIEARPTAT